MLSSSLAVSLLMMSLGTFAYLGFTARHRERDVDDYLVARDSQGALSLGLSFFASGMGAWILFAPPEVGAGVGLVGVVGYAVGAGAPICAFAIIGRRIRRVAPQGQSITGFVRARFGRLFYLYVTGISIAYMAFFLIAELTAVGGVVEIVSALDGRLAIVAVSAVTLAYTAYGGLRASMRTDNWQAWLILGLLFLGVLSIAMDLPSASDAWSQSGLLGIDRLGIEVAVTLVIAVLAANMFHQGYWQRVWAARDGRSLARGGWLGAMLSLPVVAVVGIVGILAAGSGAGLDVGPVPFFALLASLPDWVVAGMLVLAVSLVASSVDTLENAIASLLVTVRAGNTLGMARVITVVAMVPAVFVAIQGYSVLRLFLIADLLCAATVVPVLAGLWPAVTQRAALSGSLAGLVGAVVPGWISEGSVGEGLRAATFPGAVPALAPFLWALLASAAVTALTLYSSKVLAGSTSADPAPARRS